MSPSTLSAPSLRPSASHATGHSRAELYGWTCENVLSPAWEKVVRRRPTIDHLHSLEATQWLAPDEIESLQLAKLRSLLTYAGQNVPYYRELVTTLGFHPNDCDRATTCPSFRF